MNRFINNTLTKSCIGLLGFACEREIDTHIPRNALKEPFDVADHIGNVPWSIITGMLAVEMAQRVDNRLRWVAPAAAGLVVNTAAEFGLLGIENDGFNSPDVAYGVSGAILGGVIATVFNDEADVAMSSKG